MTRINVISPVLLTDQHLMAEYRELPMVMASARRSKVEGYVPSTVYTLNKGHVKFFYNKREYLEDRWYRLIDELLFRSFEINPRLRNVDFSELDKFEQVSWTPTDDDRNVNIERLLQRINEKPGWYKYYGRPLDNQSGMKKS